jgi:hypothetical protein
MAPARSLVAFDSATRRKQPELKGNSMSVITKSVSISASQEKVLGILLDVEGHPSWQKEVQKVEALERDEQGRPRLTRTYVSAMGQRATYTVSYTYPGEGQFEYHLVAGDVMTKNDFSCTVVSLDPGSSEVTVSQGIDISWPLPGFMIDQLALKGVKDMLKNLKAIAEQASTS